MKNTDDVVEEDEDVEDGDYLQQSDYDDDEQ